MESITAQTMWLLGLETLFMFAFPIVLLILWKKKTQCRLMPALAGVAVFLVFSQLLEQMLHYLMFYQLSTVGAALNNHSWLYILYVTLVAGLFEETGRFIAFRFLLKEDKDKPAAVTYGIGHGGIEMILLAGVTLLGYFFTGISINQTGFATLTADLTPEQVDTLRLTIAQINTAGAGDVLWAVLERIIAMTLHISLSVLVFIAARDRQQRRLYPIAIVLHMLCNVPAAMAQRGILTQTWLVELLTLVLVCGVALWACKLYREYKPRPEILSPLR